MIIDYSKWPADYDWKANRQRVMLDGVEIRSVCYANTETGIVVTYDIFRDGKLAHPTNKDAYGLERWTPEDFPGREVECPPDGVLKETLRGKLEILPWPKDRP